MRSHLLSGVAALAVLALGALAWNWFLSDAPSDSLADPHEASAFGDPGMAEMHTGLRASSTSEGETNTRAAVARESHGMLLRVVSRDDGSALEGAGIRVSEWSEEADASLQEITVFTNEAGEARLPLGEWSDAVVWLKGFVRASVSLGVDGELAPQEIEIPLWKAAALDCLVVDALSQRPLRNAEVTTLQVPKELFIMRSMYTDRAGRTRVEHLGLAHPVQVSCRKNGYLTKHLDDVSLFGDNPLRIELDPLGLLTGRVSWSDGSPVVGASIQLVQEPKVMPIRRRRTDEDGGYSFEVAPLGQWCRLRIQSPGCGPGIVDEPIRLGTPGEHLQRDFVLEGPRGALEVRVLDEQGRTCVRARVYIRVGVASDGPSVNGWWGWSASKKTDERGYARFEDLPVGTYGVGATTDVSNSFKGECVIRGGETTVLTAIVPGGFPLRVRILGDGGRAHSELGVRFEQEPFGADGPESHTSHTDEEGRFAAEGLWDIPGKLQVIASPGQPPFDYFVSVSWSGVLPGEQEQIFQLPPPARVRGRFLPPPSEADESFRVSLLYPAASLNSYQHNHLAVDGNGRFEFKFVPGAGPVALSLTRVADIDTSIVFPELYIEPGEVRDLGIVDGKTGLRAGGVVRDSAGKAMSAARIRVQGATDAQVRTETDETGAFHFVDLFRGPLRVHVEADYWYVQQEHNYQSAEDFDGAEFVLQRQARILGKVRSRSGDLRGNPAVLLEDTSGQQNPQRQVLNQDGVFDFHVPPGEFHIWFRAFGDIEWTPGPELALTAGEERELELELP